MRKRAPYNRTIFWKFLLAYALFAVFGVIATASVIRSLVLTQVRTEQSERLYQFATEISNTYAVDLYDARTSIETVHTQLNAFSAYLAADVWIISPSGRVVVDSRRMIPENEEIIVEGFDPAERGNNYYSVGTFFGSFEEEVLSVYAPITADYRVLAYVVAHVPMSGIEARVDSFMKFCYIQLIIVLLLSLIILIFFAEMVYVPLRRITEATEQYAAGNMDYKVSAESDDEIGYLAATLSYMAGEIARSEEDQRKFIANVSHDFRSPLTSIKGYLEAMRDGTIPPEAHDRYLGIVLNETERLSKLSNGLLTLNNLNSQEMNMELSEFDIHAVIRDAVASFEGVCRARGITVDLILSEDVAVVRADKERIRQVLYNLTDNAIKFSQDHAVIKIETTASRGKLFVSVRDTGVGIPKEDLPHIFERFYKTDHSRGKDKKGTGLGLSIVRDIIKAHGENIDVISTVGVGSEFVFSLPMVETED
ncbi:MAG: HAMP domain-containing histidine kinase [Lachnospiraceae bacterium]|nr:HAMP domain-containing histidine kinase [Lachnospiraceae bacterium]